MDFKVTGPSGPQKTDKKKKAKGAGETGAAMFSSLLNQASATSEVDAPTAVAATSSMHGVLVDESAPDIIPTDPEKRGVYMLDALEELEQDILTGSPTQAVNKLKKALEVEKEGYETLTPAQQEIADEIDLRASIEIAKIEGDS